MNSTSYFIVKTNTLNKVQAERIKHSLLQDFFEKDVTVYELDNEDKQILMTHLNTKGVNFYEAVFEEVPKKGEGSQSLPR